MSKRALIAIVLVAGAACRSAEPVPAAICRPQCPDGSACVGGSCVVRVALPATTAIELAPSSDAQAGLTEFPGGVAVAAGDLVELTADAKVYVAGSFTSTSSSLLASVGHVVVTVGSLIGGRPDLQFETTLGGGVDPNTSHDFGVSVPAGTIGRAATVQLVPLSPDDSAYPPVTAQATLAASLSLTVGASGGSVRGHLISAIGDALDNFPAKVLQAGQLVSDVVTTDSNGFFPLILPPAASGFDPGQPVTLQILPPSGTPAPSFTSQPFMVTGDTDLPNVQLPAYVQPNVFRLTVVGADGQPVSGAIVQAHTVLPPVTTASTVANGTTEFEQDSRSGDTGTVDLALLPGTASSSRAYDITVIPPAGSASAVRCLSDLPVAVGGSAVMPANVQPIVLDPRALLTGTIRDANGSAVPGVALLATRVPGAHATSCADLAGSPPGSTTTDANGSFSLPLDPGNYRVDYDPPAGSAAPRLTEMVAVTADTGHDVTLPQGGLIEGEALAPDMSPLPMAAVRFYQLTCHSSADCTGPARLAPILLGQTRADANGHFRLVIPAPN
jgi:hypothetical protein